ncbi:glycosyltransferase family 25 protein [Sedimentimonas flavescens]|uniref:Glycosyltransferase family 25 protein n=1 Tax=Sedimentimonas flavescens TaxID=2851012 RepID=A0ABT3A196_9RHOB|nr:glycosyltransferase family 25 protein [Sedimentimonas flavescens]MCV2879718.1 glycosyltransferase family 25 protein [Sedimentimonas flavescens]
MTKRDTDETPWPIFVISLAAAQERRRAISAQLQALGLPFVLFDAIDARQGVPPEYEALIDREGTQRNLGRPMSPGEYGCALSHLLVYRRICNEGLPGAIVLEDDAIVGPTFKSFVDQQAYRSAPFIQLDHKNARIWTLRPPVHHCDDFTIRQQVALSWLATGYSLRRDVACRIAEAGLPVRTVADWPEVVRQMEPFCAVPRVVDHPSAAEDISLIDAERAPLQAARQQERAADPAPPRWQRYGSRAYWRHKFVKLTSRRVS